MLLIDGVKYELWTPEGENAEEELEQMVKEHAKDIFGENSIYLDKKQKLKSLSGIGSIPDGYVIILGASPHWHIVEVELSSHPPHEHIVPQLNRFALGIKNPSTQNNLVNAIYEYISGDGFVTLKLKKETNCADIHRFLADLISKPPMLTVIIEKKTKELEEALGIFRREYQTEIVEFQTFVREGVGLLVHAHLFVPLYTVSPLLPPPPIHTPAKSLEIKPHRGEIVKARKVTFEELVSAGLLQDGQVLYFYNTQPFTDERAQVIVSSDKLKYERDGHTYSKSELASILLEKHGFKRGDYPVQGPKFWKTEAGRLLDDLNEDIRIQRGERV